MVGGQMLDMVATDQAMDIKSLEDIHKRKTGALICCAVVCGAMCSNKITTQQLEKLVMYGQSIGHAFQVIDDILDIESTTEQLGKPTGSDVDQGKLTYPSLLGLEESKQLAQKLYQQAIASLASISDNTAQLESLAHKIVFRIK